MANKQTAVDWVFDKIIRCYEEEEWIRLIEEAKAMEKEQIEEAYDNGGDHYTKTGKAIWGKDYYEETYGNNN